MSRLRPEKVRMELVGGDREQHPDEDLLTARQVATLFGFSPATVHDWWQQGRLPGFRMGGTRRGRLRFRRREVMRVLEGWREGPSSAADPQLRVVS